MDPNDKEGSKTTLRASKSKSDSKIRANNDKVQHLIKENQVVVFGKTFCPYCSEAQKVLENNDIKFYLVLLDRENDGHIVQEELEKRTNSSTVPYIFINGRYIGGLFEVLERSITGTLHELLTGCEVMQLQYDLIVIGGGSAGIAAAKEAAKFGKSVALVNFSKPTQHGNRWVLGGRAVNIGEIPRTLMHRACLFNDDYKDAQYFGWASPDDEKTGSNTETTHSWNSLASAIRQYITGVSWRLKKELREAGVVVYDNLRPEFVNHHTLTLFNDSGQMNQITGRVVIIATGTRAPTLDILGAEETITPDEMFFVEGEPERVLVIGHGIDALEVSTFMNGLGEETTILVKKGTLGNGFDHDVAEKIKTLMVARGVRFLEENVALKKASQVENTEGGVKRIEGLVTKQETTEKEGPDRKDEKTDDPEETKTDEIQGKENENTLHTEDGKNKEETKDTKNEKKEDNKELKKEPQEKTDDAKQEQNGAEKEASDTRVQFDTSVPKAELRDASKTNFEDKTIQKTEDFIEEFDLVIYAGRRIPNVGGLGLMNLRELRVSSNCKITVNAQYQTSVSNIFAIGSVADCPHRSASSSLSSHAGRFLVQRLYNFSNGPRMPLKCVPNRVFTPVEYAFFGVTEDAATKLYGEIQTYHNIFTTEESGLSNRFDSRSYVKVICTEVPAIGHQVVGLHLLCPRASDIIQGFVTSYQSGTLTKEALDNMTAVYPIASEIFSNLTVTKESGKEIGLQPF